MKWLFILLVFCSCAHDKDFKKRNGAVVHAQTYGWADYQDCHDTAVIYRVSVGNVVWSVIASETLVVPIVLTGYDLFEPVKLKDGE